MLFCGIDIGTTNTKALLVNSGGLIIDRMVIGQQPQVDIHRIDANIWYQHFCAVMEKFHSHFVNESVYVSMATQGSSFALLDKNFKAIAPAWIWTGRATLETVKRLESNFTANELYDSTGWQPLEFLIPCKLREYYESNVNHNTNYHYLVTVPDYITSQLAQAPITDITNAQMTGFLDIKSSVWRKDICEWARCEIGAMSQVVNENRIIFEKINTPWGKINITTSSHDQYAAMEAAGIINSSAMLGCGTAWVLNGKHNTPIYDNKEYIVHPGRDLYGGYGFILSLGAVGQVFERLLNRCDINYERLAQLEKTFDLKCIPNGTIDTSVPDNCFDTAAVILCYMQAISARVLFYMEKLGINNNLGKLIMAGGAAKSSVWPQILADMCGIMVETVEFQEFTALGAALFAKYAATGERAGFEMLSTTKKLYLPSEKRLYGKWYANIQRPYLKNAGIRAIM
jgi:sugar (pentulose or hexulose) kinase